MFEKAKRSQVKIKAAITGPSGAGKTYSALTLAQGLSPNGKVAVIDTENGSASLYADQFEFDTATIKPPYTTEKYITAIKAAVDAGYDVVIVDSLTHAWAGEGGLLQQKEQIDARGGNTYTNWARITPKHEALLAGVLHSDCHLIATMRSKQDYVLSDRNGKQVPMKVGLAPVQRDGMEYEFTVVFDVAMNHEAVASKDRTGLFDGQAFKIDRATGKRIADWLSGATVTAAAVVEAPAPPPVTELADMILTEVEAASAITDEVKDKIRKAVASAKEADDADKLTKILNKLNTLKMGTAV